MPCELLKLNIKTNDVYLVLLLGPELLLPWLVVQQDVSTQRASIKAFFLADSPFICPCSSHQEKSTSYTMRTRNPVFVLSKLCLMHTFLLFLLCTLLL